MRVLVLFDMPTMSKEDRKHHAKFRARLIKEGFIMLQYSVYMRICRGISSATHYIDKIKLILPPKGHIRALMLTEKQFDNMKLLLGDRSKSEKANRPRQLSLF